MASGFGFSEIFVFGDSLSDNGNRIVLSRRTRFFYRLARWWFKNFCAGRAAAFDGGRHSDGMVAMEFIARDLQLDLKPAWANKKGSNFAVSGATVVEHKWIPNLKRQVDLMHQRWQHNGRLPDDALYVIYIGGNDILDAVRLPPKIGPLRINRVVDGICQEIERLADAGATKFLVPNIGDVGNTPKFTRAWFFRKRMLNATRLCLHFNCRLEAALDRLKVQGNIELARFHSFQFGKELREDPDDSRWSNLSESCLASCKRCDFGTFFFFDGLHPTSARHQVNANALMHAIKSTFS